MVFPISTGRFWVDGFKALRDHMQHWTKPFIAQGFAKPIMYFNDLVGVVEFGYIARTPGALNANHALVLQSSRSTCLSCLLFPGIEVG